MVIAVDFDGTIVEHRYPRIGDLLPCFPNDTLILNPFSLYTHRHDKILSGVNDDDELWP